MKSNSMILEYEYLISLLKSFCHQTIPEKRENVNWEKMAQLSIMHSVQGILSYMVISYNLSDDLEFLKTMRYWCKKNIALYAGKNQAMQLLVKELEGAKIEHIVFKGYVIKDFYPIPELRSYGDIDIVIHLRDRKKSHQLMLDLDYKVKTDWEAVYSYYRNNEYYEIHSDIMEINFSNKANYCEYFKNMWEYTVKRGEYTREFAPEYHFIYLLNHIAKHIYGSGAGIRMYLDLAMFIKKYENRLDWDYIKVQIETLNLYDFYCTVMSAVKKWFDVEGEIALKQISENVLEEFLVFTMSGGIFGYDNREKGVSVLKKAPVNEKKIGRIVVVLRRMFPPKKELEKRYRYLEKYSWLLPWAWIHRFLKTQKTWKKHLKEAESIISVEEDEIKKMRAFHESIGL